jgi:hypothetical protein
MYCMYMRSIRIYQDPRYPNADWSINVRTLWANRLERVPWKNAARRSMQTTFRGLSYINQCKIKCGLNARNSTCVLECFVWLAYINIISCYVTNGTSCALYAVLGNVCLLLRRYLVLHVRCGGKPGGSGEVKIPRGQNLAYIQMLGRVQCDYKFYIEDFPASQVRLPEDIINLDIDSYWPLVTIGNLLLSVSQQTTWPRLRICKNGTFSGRHRRLLALNHSILVAPFGITSKKWDKKTLSQLAGFPFGGWQTKCVIYTPKL